MAYYIVMFGFMFILSLKNYFYKNNKLDFLLFSFILFILAFNYQMGTDWINYKNFYNSSIFLFRDNNFRINFEKGYIIYNYIFKNVFKINYELFMGFTILICCYKLIFKLKQESQNYYLAIYIYIAKYLFVVSIEPVIRQLIATSIIVYGLKYIEQKKIVKFTLVILIASQFHISALLFLGIYFLDKINITLKETIIIWVLLALIIYNLKEILSYIPYLNSYSRYFLTAVHGVKTNKSLKGILVLSFKMISYFYIIFYGYDKLENKKNYIKNLSIIGVLLMQYYNVIPILYRVQQYFLYFIVIALSYISNLKSINFYLKKMLVLSFLTINGFIFFKEINRTELNRFRYFPYKNYFIELAKGKIKEENSYTENKYILQIKEIIKRNN